MLFTGAHLINLDELTCISFNADEDGKLKTARLNFKNGHTINMGLHSARALHRYICVICQPSSEPVTSTASGQAAASISDSDEVSSLKNSQ